MSIIVVVDMVFNQVIGLDDSHCEFLRITPKKMSLVAGQKIHFSCRTKNESSLGAPPNAKCAAAYRVDQS